jgi:phenylacetic acid degradation operon negative regulatory protein
LTEIARYGNESAGAPTAKSLILDLLSTLRGAAMPVRALVRAGDVFGIAENGMRVELARLVARGLVERDERGSYRIAGPAEAVQSRVVSWSRIEERITAWTGGWIGVHTGSLPRSDRRAARRRQRAFDFLGFRELDTGLWIRPDNLRGGIADVRRQLEALGLDGGALVFALGALDDATETRARKLWDVAALRAGYRALHKELVASERRLEQLPDERAMVETFVLGGRAIRELVLDPLLPEAILPTVERRALVRAMRRYDQVGRERWRPFMRAHGAPGRRSPVDLRLTRGDGERAAAAGGTR